MKIQILILCLSASALAQTETEAESGQSWSAVGPRTIESGGNMLEVSAGWPGLSVAYYRGVVPRLNLGVRAGFHYGIEGLLRQVAPGLKAQLLLKWLLLEVDRVSLGLVFEPGPIFYAPPGQVPTRGGFAIPLGLRLGIAAASAVSVGVMIDLPMWVEFGTRSNFNLPILTGVGVEYFVTSTLALLARVQLGPTLRVGWPAELTLNASLGVAFRF